MRGRPPRIWGLRQIRLPMSISVTVSIDFKYSAPGPGWIIGNQLALDRRGRLCHIGDVTPFRFEIRPGEPIFDQVVFAAKKAIISGEFPAGRAFPSVRTLAAELKIHPNTAHKAIQYLIQEKLLEVLPGIGTVVADLPVARAGERKRLLQLSLIHI